MLVKLRLSAAVTPILLLPLAILAAQPAAPTLLATEELRIDGMQHDLVTPSWVMVGQKGQIAVSQPQNYSVLLFSAEGRLVGRFGGRGQGPGELGSPAVLAGFSGDTLWVHDRQNRRVTFLDARLGVIRETPVGQLQGVAGAGRLFPSLLGPHVKAVFGGDTLVVRATITPQTSTADFVSAHSYLLRVAPAGRITDVLAHLPPNSARWYAQVGDRIRSGLLPFGHPDIDTVSFDGRRLLSVKSPQLAADGNKFSVTVSDLRSGAPIFARAYDFRPVEVARSTVQARYDQLLQDNPEVRSAIRARFTYPTTETPYVDAFLGNDHSVWIQLNERQNGAWVWMVLDGAGAPYGYIALPSSRQLKAASLTHMWITERDSLGVTSIVRLRLRRP